MGGLGVGRELLGRTAAPMRCIKRFILYSQLVMGHTHRMLFPSLLFRSLFADEPPVPPKQTHHPPPPRFAFELPPILCVPTADSQDSSNDGEAVDVVVVEPVETDGSGMDRESSKKNQFELKKVLIIIR